MVELARYMSIQPPPDCRRAILFPFARTGTTELLQLRFTKEGQEVVENRQPLRRNRNFLFLAGFWVPIPALGIPLGLLLGS